MSRVVGPVLAGLAVLALLVASSAILVLDPMHAAVILREGQPARVLNAAGGDPGAHWIAPGIETPVLYDRRLKSTVTPPVEAGSADGQPVKAAVLIAYRVADARAAFRAFGRDDAAAEVVQRLALPAVGGAIGRTSYAELATGKTDAMAAQVRAALIGPMRARGLALVDVAVDRAGRGPAGVAVVDKRMADAAAAQAAAAAQEGRRKVAEIEADRAQQVAEIAREAEAQAAKVRAAGEARALDIANAAYARDPAFASLMRYLDTYEATLGKSGAVIVVTPDSPFLKYFGGQPGAKAPSASRP